MYAEERSWSIDTVSERPSTVIRQEQYQIRCLDC
ncbi:hypothetical protein DJFAAGMI_04503 [Comamonas sp. PE63]|uniref:Uncharacterized protein n=1 Tax=Comamonas brasiliensis TaxID=1812482 RepID=A0ABS5M0B4_9BURK|nr:hypothetical protein [Comamonas sp. PE63]